MLKKINLSVSLIIQIILFCTVCSCTNIKDSVESKLEETKTLFKNGEYNKCIELCNVVLKVNKANYQAHHNKGDCLFMSGQHEEALAEYDMVTKLKPDYAKAYGAKGYTLSQLKRYEEALTAYDMVIKLKPDYAEAYGTKGDILS